MTVTVDEAIGYLRQEQRVAVYAASGFAANSYELAIMALQAQRAGGKIAASKLYEEPYAEAMRNNVWFRTAIDKIMRDGVDPFEVILFMAQEQSKLVQDFIKHAMTEHLPKYAGRGEITPAMFESMMKEARGR